MKADLESMNLEVERQKERRDKLVAEVTFLDGQKVGLMNQLEAKGKEKEMLQADVTGLTQEVASLKQKMAQYEQNLEAFQSLSQRKRQSEEEDREFLLREREQAVQQHEMELKSQEDMLYQRKKELDLREFDIGSGSGQEQHQQVCD